MRFFTHIGLIGMSCILAGCQIEVTVLQDQSSGSDHIVTDEPVNNNPSTPEPLPAPKEVTLYWSSPVERENGSPMAHNEVGGYEIRYRSTEGTSYQSLITLAPDIEHYVIQGIENADSFIFEVAVFDSEGIYSDFVVATLN